VANIAFLWQQKLIICVFPWMFVAIVMKNRGKYNILVATKTYHLCFSMDVCRYRDEKAWKI
jgi:hypothetical protein